MTDEKMPGPTQAERFGQFAMAAAREAGYDVDSPRGGGRKAIAEASGMGQTAVGRMLAGQSVPEPKFFPGLATALRIDLRTLLIRSGLATEEMLPVKAPSSPVRQRLTPEVAARELGIRSERGVKLFESLVQGILAQEPANGDAARGSGAA
jgi:transcriptional regulator with XRE-family HTH domain